MDMVLKYHPGLEFLAETAEFQKKYAETVVFRIFYSLNRWGYGQGLRLTGATGVLAWLLWDFTEWHTECMQLFKCVPWP